MLLHGSPQLRAETEKRMETRLLFPFQMQIGGEINKPMLNYLS
jgi:hypothetical protein